MGLMTNRMLNEFWSDKYVYKSWPLGRSEYLVHVVRGDRYQLLNVLVGGRKGGKSVGRKIKSSSNSTSSIRVTLIILFYYYIIFSTTELIVKFTLTLKWFVHYAFISCSISSSFIFLFFFFSSRSLSFWYRPLPYYTTFLYYVSLCTDWGRLLS